MKKSMEINGFRVETDAFLQATDAFPTGFVEFLKGSPMAIDGLLKEPHKIPTVHE